MELSKPTRGVRHGARLSKSLFVAQIAQAHRAVNVFQNNPRLAGSRVGVGAQAFWAKIRQRPQQAPINLRLIGHIAAVTKRVVAATARVLYKQPALAAIGQLAGHDLIWERAHEPWQFTSENFHRTRRRTAVSQRCGEAGLQCWEAWQKSAGCFHRLAQYREGAHLESSVQNA